MNLPLNYWKRSDRRVPSMRNIAVIGSSGAIGRAMIEHLSSLYPEATVNAYSRTPPTFANPQINSYKIDYDSEQAISLAADTASQLEPLDLVFVATGKLHDQDLMPEKSVRDLSAQKFLDLFTVNTVTPALIAKYFIPKMATDRLATFAALSARVGSISDNYLGGWYSYRASKAALNMIIKNLAIETARRNKLATIVSLHPGTVESDLSKPFQANVPAGKLFTPAYAAEKLCQVLVNLSPEQTGKCFAWDGNEIEP